MPTPTIITLEPILPVQIVAKAFPEVLAGDVNVSVNGTLYDSETAPGAVNIPVTNLDDDSVGVVTPGVGVKVGNSLVIIKKTGGALIESKAVVAEGVAETTIDDSVVVIKDSGGVTLYSKTVKADDVAEQVVNDATVNVRKSDGVLIAAVPVKAQAIEPYNVANSTVTMKDTGGLTLDSKSVKATESAEFTAPNATAPIKDSAGVLLKTEVFKSGETRDVGIGDSTVAVKDSGGVTLHTKTVKAQGTAEQVVSDSVLTLNSGAFLNVKAQASQNIQLLSSVDDSPIVPVSVVGPVIKVAPGGGSFNVGLVDRFGNDLGTKPVSANATWDLRTLTPFDWADLYLSRLVNPPTGAQLTAVYTFFTDLISAGVFQKLYGIHPIIGGTADDHKWNAKYPFNENNAGVFQYYGSPTHNANGISLNGSTQAIATNFSARNFKNLSKHLTIYKRNQSTTATNGMCFGTGSGSRSLALLDRWSSNQMFGLLESSSFGLAPTVGASDGQGMLSLKRDGANLGVLYRNGSVFLTNSSFAYGDNNNTAISIGGVITETGSLTQLRPVDFSYFAYGEALTNAEESNHYNIVQALQTAFSRQV